MQGVYTTPGVYGVVANQTILFVNTPLNGSVVNEIWRVDGNYVSHVVGREINLFQGFVAGVGYNIDIKAPVDISAFVVQVNGGQSGQYSSEYSSEYTH